MNKKITVRNPFNEICYCILSGDKDFEEQFNCWLFGSAHSGEGMCARFHDATLDMVDYYHGETIASFQILSIEDTEEKTILRWVGVEASETDQI